MISCSSLISSKFGIACAEASTTESGNTTLKTVEASREHVKRCMCGCCGAGRDGRAVEWCINARR
jgi:hypothetical protein